MEARHKLGGCLALLWPPCLTEWDSKWTISDPFGSDFWQWLMEVSSDTSGSHRMTDWSNHRSKRCLLAHFISYDATTEWSLNTTGTTGTEDMNRLLTYEYQLIKGWFCLTCHTLPINKPTVFQKMAQVVPIPDSSGPEGRAVPVSPGSWCSCQRQLARHSTFT